MKPLFLRTITIVLRTPSTTASTIESALRQHLIATRGNWFTSWNAPVHLDLMDRPSVRPSNRLSVLLAATNCTLSICPTITSSGGRLPLFFPCCAACCLLHYMESLWFVYWNHYQWIVFLSRSLWLSWVAFDKLQVLDSKEVEEGRRFSSSPPLTLNYCVSMTRLRHHRHNASGWMHRVTNGGGGWIRKWLAVANGSKEADILFVGDHALYVIFIESFLTRSLMIFYSAHDPFILDRI